MLDEDVLAQQAVARWVKGLPKQLRTVYEGLYRDNLSQRALACRMGVSQPRVAKLHANLLRLGPERFVTRVAA